MCFERLHTEGMLMEKTTITLSQETKARLEALKAHPRQSYEEVIARMLNEQERGERCS